MPADLAVISAAGRKERGKVAPNLVAMALGVLASSGLVGYALHRRAVRQRRVAAVRKVNEQRQRRVIAVLERLGELISDADLPSGEVDSQATLMLDEIASLAEQSGDLDPLIADTRQFVAEALAKRTP